VVDILVKLSRLCVHTFTTRSLSIEQAADAYARKGIGGITIWRQALEGRSPAQTGIRIREAGLEIVSLCRGGFFPGHSRESRQAAIDENRRAIDEAAALNASLLVIAPGAIPQQPLAESRRQIMEAVAAILPHAEACGVRLGLEPLHPMYAADRSAINTLKSANDACQELGSPSVGVVVDVYHLWWEPDLEVEIARCGREGRIFAFHISDWKTDTSDMLADRGLMGEGCIPLRQICAWVETAGFSGFHEVEIFSHRYWNMDQEEYLELIVNAYRKEIEPCLK
jgi:sugar phosphate isomerase/epimerase